MDLKSQAFYGFGFGGFRAYQAFRVYVSEGLQVSTELDWKGSALPLHVKQKKKHTSGAVSGTPPPPPPPMVWYPSLFVVYLVIGRNSSISTP